MTALDTTDWRFEPNSDLFENRTILVTGAGDGIGATLARTIAQLGGNVVLLGRTRQKLETVFDWIEANTETQAVIVPCDLAELNLDSVNALSDAIADTYGHLDGLVHNASILGPRLPIAHYPHDAWLKVMQVNVNAPFMLTQGLFHLLDKAPEASVVYVSSSVGREGRAYWGAYSASKFALEGLSQILADETEQAGKIHVYSVNPGATRTAMRASAYPNEDPQTVPEPTAHMDLFTYLLGGLKHGEPLPETGSQLDARTWRKA
ncbi:MAG: YciK family oxidoreductase [Pseudomonadales bacterium]|nr:YciK family oxidoreductase [Pseudomonadales bacterium]